MEERLLIDTVPVGTLKIGPKIDFKPLDLPNRIINVLSLGAGVQSTALYMMAMKGLVDPIDLAVFADVGDEPASVYKHLAWMRSLGGPPIYVISIGQLSHDLIQGRGATGYSTLKPNGQRFASIPAFTSTVDGAPGGMTKRQCTQEYKLEPINKFLRQAVMGLKYRQRSPSEQRILQFIGISLDEVRRSIAVTDRNKDKAWTKVRFPLIEKFLTREQIKTWLSKQNIPHQVPRSSCVECPFHKNIEWQRLKDEEPADFARAVAIDKAIRDPNARCTAGMRQALYLHRSCKPLDEVDFKTGAAEDLQQNLGFWQECSGLCGN
jgi:hypothetical protein